ncbi:hypothetical protein BD779DRAFT_1478635 [Infundibulicybe gibba]|nr:hypothetical protein BD779DRAFT_1478635 [Infundibulicybe gibba]
MAIGRYACDMDAGVWVVGMGGLIDQLAGGVLLTSGPRRRLAGYSQEVITTPPVRNTEVVIVQLHQHACIGRVLLEAAARIQDPSSPPPHFFHRYLGGCRVEAALKW